MLVYLSKHLVDGGVGDFAMIKGVYVVLDKGERIKMTCLLKLGLRHIKRGIAINNRDRNNWFARMLLPKTVWIVELADVELADVAVFGLAHINRIVGLICGGR